MRGKAAAADGCVGGEGGGVGAIDVGDKAASERAVGVGLAGDDDRKCEPADVDGVHGNVVTHLHGAVEDGVRGGGDLCLAGPLDHADLYGLGRGNAREGEQGEDRSGESAHGILRCTNSINDGRVHSRDAVVRPDGYRTRVRTRRRKRDSAAVAGA